MAWNMVRHAFLMVFGNLKHSLRASIAPLAIGIIASLGIFTMFGLSYSDLASAQMGQVEDPMMMEEYVPAFLLMLVLYLFVFSWVAVTWHRFILLEEYPGILPAFNGEPILNYIGKTILLALLTLLIAFPLVILFGLIAAPPMMSDSGSAGGLIFDLVVGTILTWFWFRFAIVLPGTAVGRPMKLGQGWDATRQLSGDIFFMAVILAGLNIAAIAIVTPISIGMPLIGMILNIAVSWVTLMVGASILTTLYGHLIEGRPLT